MITRQLNEAVSAMLTAIIVNNPNEVTYNLSQRGIAVHALDVHSFVMKINQVEFTDKMDALMFLSTVLDVQIIPGNQYASDLSYLRQKFDNRRVGEIAYAILNKALGNPDISGNMPQFDRIKEMEKTDEVLGQLTPEQFRVFSGAVMFLTLLGAFVLIIVLTRGTTKILNKVFN